jgi:hypothetical protein
LKSDPATNDSLWFVNYETLKKLPPVFIFRPTHWPVIPGGTEDMVSEGSDRIVARGKVPLFYLVWAYDFHGTNIILPRDFPAQEKYDLMLTLTNQPLKILQMQIKKQFGVEAHRELREGQWALVVEKAQ